MCKPVLVIMAAGMGSRYGGLKQLDPVGPNGQAIMDYNLYDALQAGFEEAVFVISPGMAADGFEESIKKRVGKKLKIHCAVQNLTDLPNGFDVPEGRTKPWGTGHAVRSCRGLFNAPFAVVNADDYYGRSGFESIFAFLSEHKDDKATCAMVGYQLSNTMTENGSVSRGVCSVTDDGELLSVCERTRIINSADGPMFTEDQINYIRLPEDQLVSMNFWGFTADFMKEFDQNFAEFLKNMLPVNPLKSEYFLPTVVNNLLDAKQAKAWVLPCKSRWYGMTHREDKQQVVNAMHHMTEEGLYPENLWT